MQPQIKLFDSWYLGKRSQGQEAVPLGFLTPGGTDSAAKNRKKTVVEWTLGGYGSVQVAIPPEDDFKASEPISGFSLSRSIRRSSSWNGGNVVWRIEDPRGFELEISSENLGQIMSCSTVVNGEFHGKMVWARESGKNILVPVNSEVYKKAIEDTAVATSKTTGISKIPVGTWVTLKNGVRAQYAGKFFLVERTCTSDPYGYEATKFRYGIKLTETHVLISKAYENQPASVIHYSDPRVVTIHENQPLIDSVPLLSANIRLGYQQLYLRFGKVESIKYSFNPTNAESFHSSTTTPVVVETGIIISPRYYSNTSNHFYCLVAEVQFADGTKELINF